MSLSAPFIRRPVGTALLTVAVALAGILAYFFLPVSPLPEVDFPMISVSRGIAGGESGDDGVGSGDAFGAAIRAHRRRE